MNRLICIVILLNIVQGLTAQNELQTLVTGDTVVLQCIGCTGGGTLQWQESTDSIAWTDIPGATVNYFTFVTGTVPGNRLFYRALCNDTGCPAALPAVSSVIRHQILDSIGQAQPGDRIRGGIVYHIYGNGTGLIAAETDQSSNSIWGCYRVNFAGAMSDSNGFQNTADILAGCTTRPIAASVCDNLNIDGHRDWYLPARNELNLLYQNQVYFGNFFTNYYYWSSTSYDSSYAWMQQFSNGNQTVWGKNFGEYTRCIRSYSPADTLPVKFFSAAHVSFTPATPVYITTQPASQNKCKGSSTNFYVHEGGTPPFTYQWKKNGDTIPGATNYWISLNSVTQNDEGIYSCDVANICQSLTSQNAELKVIEINASAGSDVTACMNSGNYFHATAVSNYTAISVPFSFHWFPETGIDDPYSSSPYVAPDTAMCYELTATDQLGCKARDTACLSMQYPFENDEICLASADSSSNAITIRWQPQTGKGTERFFLFRDVVGHVYEQVAELTFDTLIVFTDTSANADLRSFSYRITAIDTCGNESQKSDFHKTIFLSVTEETAGEMLLEWNPYETASGLFTPAGYSIYRGHYTSQMQLLTTISGTHLSYTDPAVYQQMYYRVECESPCGNTRIFSNTCGNGIEGSGVMHTVPTIKIYPNPFNNYTTLILPENIAVKQIRILDVSGKMLYSREPENQNTLRIERGSLPAGIFILEIKADKVYRTLLMIE